MADGRDTFVVVANRLPVDEVITESGREWRRSPGGLVTALHPILAAHRGHWVGWAGSTGPAPKPFELDGIHLHPVPLSEQEFADYYEGQSNATIWPLYHDAVETPVFHRHWRDAYREVNRRFAEATDRVAPAGASVWVQDYQLQLVPAMLRERRPDLRIGFFLHIPFPPVELFMQLPQREEIIRGLLGADLVGFQSPLAANNFLHLAHHLLGARRRGATVEKDGRTVRAGAFPVSIDIEELETLAADPAVRNRAAEIRSELGEPKTLILGVDRLDYTKGIQQRLQAYHELLIDGRLTTPETVLVQVATPSRERVEHYARLRENVEREVGRINGEFGRVGAPAVHYLHQSYERSELAALYLAADVMAVTPLRDGMNLVAKEYVAARADLGGALVLSEFAGAARELRQAYMCNPHDIDSIKDAIMRAIEADPSESAKRMNAMRRYLRAHGGRHWAAEFLSALEAAPSQPEEPAGRGTTRAEQGEPSPAPAPAGAGG
ncbi:MAG TPA: trehalose-6-phosphate synthase [Micromonosporaceae bacterium]|nr:trehalose-6-phosphate synthase [Micromonosporaceae bacterium]